MRRLVALIALILSVGIALILNFLGFGIDKWYLYSTAILIPLILFPMTEIFRKKRIEFLKEKANRQMQAFLIKLKPYLETIAKQKLDISIWVIRGEEYIQKVGEIDFKGVANLERSIYDKNKSPIPRFFSDTGEIMAIEAYPVYRNQSYIGIPIQRKNKIVGAIFILTERELSRELSEELVNKLEEERIIFHLWANLMPYEFWGL